MILLSDLDFVALNNEDIFLMRLHQTRANSRRDRSIIASPAQKNIWVGLSFGLSLIYLFYFANEGHNRVVGWLVIKLFRKGETQIN